MKPRQLTFPWHPNHRERPASYINRSQVESKITEYLTSTGSSSLLQIARGIGISVRVTREVAFQMLENGQLRSSGKNKGRRLTAIGDGAENQ